MTWWHRLTHECIRLPVARDDVALGVIEVCIPRTRHARDRIVVTPADGMPPIVIPERGYYTAARIRWQAGSTAELRALATRELNR